MLHSWYWRSWHFTREEVLFFQFGASETFRDHFIQSNAFVPVKSLPSVLQWFVNVNPISHLVTAVRELVNNSAVTGDLWISLLGAAVIVAIFAPLTVRAYMRKA